MDNDYSKEFALFFIISAAFLMFLFFVKDAAQKKYFVKGEIALEDTADVLTIGEKKVLAEKMEEVTDYCNVLFYSGSKTDRTLEEEAGLAYDRAFEAVGQKKGIIFLVDADTREARILAAGKLKGELSEEYCKKIAKEVQGYAENEEYYACAVEAYAKIKKYFAGLETANVLKGLCYLVLAMAAALSLVFAYVRGMAKRYRLR